MASSLRPEAQSGFAAAGAYDSGRPTYSVDVVEQLLQKLELSGIQHAKVLDLAAGTGKFTEVLSSRPEEFDIVAVEPHDDMREQLSQKALRRVSVLKGSAEQLHGIDDGTFDAVIAAQVRTPDHNSIVAANITTVFSLGFAMQSLLIATDNAPRSWDIHDGWESQMRDVVWQFDDKQPRFRHEQWKAVFDEQNRSNPLTLHFADPLFGLPIGEDAVPYKVWLPADAIWNRIRTLSQIAVLSGTELEEVESAYRKSLTSEATEVDGHDIALHGRTFFAWTSKIPEAPLKSGG